MGKMKWHIVWGIGITVVFLILLIVRLEIFQEKPTAIEPDRQVDISRPPVSWMNIYQDRKKIGFIRRTFHKLDNGRIQTEENVTLQINTMGVSQMLNIATETELNADMTFSSFHFLLHSSLFRFQAKGYVEKDKLIVYAGVPSALEKTVLPVKNIPHISGNIYEAAFRGRLGINQKRKFSIFDPSTLGMREISVTRHPDEVILIMGKRILTQKFCADFMGAKNCAWLAKDGETLKESGMLGMTLEKVSAKTAQEGLSQGGSADFTEIASIPSNVQIDDPSAISSLVVKLEGLQELPLGIFGGRQKYSRGILTITRESASERTSQEPDASLQKYLQPSLLVQANAPEIKKQAQAIVASADASHVKIKKIVTWVHKSIEKKPSLSVPNALEVLKNKTGDCNEHAVLTAALLRAAGIPAQIETGLVYMKGRFYYHAWNTAYDGRWITVDTVLNQIPADVTHIRLTRGDGGEQLDLLGVMGKLKLEVLSTTK
jgi:hypothetical protein